MATFSDITIDAFRGLRGIDLQDLSQVNLIVGPNNGGKTSLLEAIALLAEPLDPLGWSRIAGLRVLGAGAFRMSPPIERTKWLFPHAADGAFGPIDIGAGGRLALRHVRVEFESVAVANPFAEDGSEEEPEQAEGLNMTTALQLDTDTGPWERLTQTFLVNPWGSRHRSENPYFNYEFVHPCSHRTAAVETSVSRAHANGWIENVVDLVKAFDPNVDDIQLLKLDDRGSRPSVYLQNRTSGVTPLFVYGEGTRRVVQLATLLPELRGGVLLIDEIEAALHISVFRRVFAWLLEAARELDIQIFATTHSLEAVDGILEAMDEQVQSLALFKLNHEMATNSWRVARVGSEQLENVRHEMGIDVR